MEKSGIFPPAFPKEWVDDPLRRAELRVFERLRDQLTDFTVFYNCNWFDTSSRANRTDGEADFIVAHPKWGFIVLEVKGGQISRDERTRIWRSRDRRGQSFEIKNPVEQARTSKYVILNKVRDLWKGAPPFIRVAHGVILPDSGRPVGINALGADMPLEIFLFREDMKELGAGVVRILLGENGQSATKYGELGLRGIGILHGLFDRGFDLRVSLSTELKEADERILELTNQQKAYLDFLALQRKALITGGAGTGKTTLAVEKSRRLANAGASVLLLCFNNGLAEYLKAQVADLENVTAASFHQLCGIACARAGIPVNASNSDNRRQYFEKVLPDALLNALSREDDFRFDAVIVDEGQDFHENWWLPLLLAMKKEEGVFYVFKDDNQRIYDTSGMRIPGIPEEPLRLSVNFRNTKPIFLAATKFYEGGELQSGGPEGKNIEWANIRPESASRDVEKLINRLTNIEGIPKSHIAVLCACNLKKSVIYGDGSIGSYETRRANSPTKDSVIFDSVFRFKGLESKVVILTDIDLRMNSDELLYVGMSRARLLLIVAAPDQIVRNLQRYLAPLDLAGSKFST